MRVLCSGWPNLTCIKNSDNNEETEGRDEGSENDYTNGGDEMMEVEKESIRKSEAERDIGNKRERENQWYFVTSRHLF